MVIFMYSKDYGLKCLFQDKINPQVVLDIYNLVGYLGVSGFTHWIKM